MPFRFIIATVILATGSTVALAQPCAPVQTELVVLRLSTDDAVTIQADPYTPALQILPDSDGVHAVVGPSGFSYEETEIDFPGGYFPLEALNEIMPEGLELLLHPTLNTCSGEPASLTVGSDVAGTATTVQVEALSTGKGYDLSVTLTRLGPAFNSGIPLNLMRVTQPVLPGEPLLATRQVSPGEWIVMYLQANPDPR